MQIDDVTQTEDYYIFILIYEVLGQFRQVMNNLRILSSCVIITIVSTHQNIQDYSYRNYCQEFFLKLLSLKQTCILICILGCSYKLIAQSL